MITLEICAESVESALAAARFGASRIEFCDNMAEGGTTPSAGAVRVLRRESGIALFPIIRPRGGDFVYTALELEAMELDIRLYGEAGCDGVVFGILYPDGTVDAEMSTRLVGVAREYGMGTTFHRAFDVCRDLHRSLETIIGCGFDRVLTSGGAPTAREGVDVIADLVRQAAGRISVMAGSGITPENAADIIARTGCTEIHGTFRSLFGSYSYGPAWAGYNRWIPDGEKIKKVIENIKTPAPL